MIGKKKRCKTKRSFSSFLRGKGINLSLPSRGRITVRIPDQAEDEIIEDEQHHNNDESELSASGAAKVIQKEVRNYLGNLGFYEAREIN